MHGARVIIVIFAYQVQFQNVYTCFKIFMDKSAPGNQVSFQISTYLYSSHVARNKDYNDFIDMFNRYLEVGFSISSQIQRETILIRILN